MEPGTRRRTGGEGIRLEGYPLIHLLLTADVISYIFT